jgi:hypothetical protein
MQPFDIYRIAVPWGGCDDPRPWLIVDVRPKGMFGCCPIASQCYCGSCYRIDCDHDDFCHTGLTKTCYVHYSPLFSLSTPTIQAGKRLGSLQHNLLGHFRFTTNL